MVTWLDSFDRKKMPGFKRPQDKNQFLHLQCGATNGDNPGHCLKMGNWNTDKRDARVIHGFFKGSSFCAAEQNPGISEIQKISMQLNLLH